MKLWGQPTKGRSKDPSQPSQKEGPPRSHGGSFSDGSTTNGNKNDQSSISQGRTEELHGGQFFEPLDNLWYALIKMSDGDPTRAGLEQIANQLIAGICKQGNLEPIFPQVGEEFDPYMHESIALGDGPINKIIEVMRLGFRHLGGPVQRPARVIVGNGNMPLNGGNESDEIQQMLEMSKEQAIAIWDRHGQPLIHLSPGENCLDLVKLLGQREIKPQHLSAIREWLRKHPEGNYAE